MKRIVFLLLGFAGCFGVAMAQEQLTMLNTEKLFRTVQRNGGRGWIFFKSELPDFTPCFFDTNKAMYLKPGFAAPSGSVFNAVISSCNLTVY